MKPDGLFLFSAHNLQFVPVLLSWKLSAFPSQALLNLIVCLRLRWKNRSIKDIKSPGHVYIVDHTHNYGLLQYFITPEAQVRQLAASGFKNTRVYSQNDGCEITSDLNSNVESWLAYLSEK
jgi:hypothetical protein